MRVEKDAYGLSGAAGDPRALNAYPRSKAIIEKPVPEGSYRHPWLTANAGISAPQAPPSPSANLAQPGSHLQRLQRFAGTMGTASEMDTLYVALARSLSNGLR